MENTVPLIDCIVEITGKEIAMRGDEYVYLYNKESVEQNIITEAQVLFEKRKNEQVKQDSISAIDNLIQSKIDEYNEANMVAFKNIDACAKYTAVPTYTHYQFCVDVIEWQTNVWEVARGVMADVTMGNRQPPSLEEFLAELPVFGA